MPSIQLPLHDSGARKPRSRSPFFLLLVVPILAFIHLSPLSPASVVSGADKVSWSSSSTGRPLKVHPGCPKQGEPLVPKRTLELPQGYRGESAERLSKAVKIATVSYDNNGLPSEDPRWAPFFQFNDFLVATFPEVFTRPETKLEKVNELGLLVKIQGTDKNLKPLLLLSHIDVTPAPLETYDRWTHPPFSGYNDGEYIWGRGASDDKTLLIAQYEALAILLSDPGFKPRRTVILSHGFDEEEVFARQGAGELAKFLEARHGPDSMLLVIDEGTSLDDNVFGEEFAVPSTSEKGYVDVKFTVGTLGGHSSVPTPHSGIGVMADIVHALEANPYPTSFKADDPILGHLSCAYEHSPGFPKHWSKLLKKAKFQALSEEFGKQSLAHHALVSTTQAIDVISGGSKVNSLPEEVVLLMNHRIAFSSSVNLTQQHIIHTVKPIVKLHNLELSAFEDEIPKLGSRFLKIELFGLPLEPAPRSPTSGGVWDLFAGSIQHAFPTKSGKNRVVSPFSSTGNTDTKVYHNLSRSVFRFKGEASSGGGNAHTVDEKAGIDSHLSIIKWIHTIVQNADAYDGEQ